MLRDRIESSSRRGHLAWMTILTGVFLTLFLQSLISDEVFYSGDGGLKALLAKQFAAGSFHVDLRLDADAWVRDLWGQGLYPFESPFVYQRSGGRYIAFPFYYSLLSAPFYALLGFRGLYLIPLLSTWLLWFRFRKVCNRLRLSDRFTSLALATLIFASPLTLYSAMYWEHSLAVLLAFWGMTVAVTPRSCPVAPRKALLGGLLVGLSVWLRPEMICLTAVLCVLIGASRELCLSKRGRIGFVCGALCVVLLLGMANVTFYRHPLGFHALQVIENSSILDKLGDSLRILVDSSIELSFFFPITLFPVPFLLVVLLDRGTRLPLDMKTISIVCFSFVLLVPLILPNSGGKQWGPRFLLFLVPLLALLATLRLKLILEHAPKVSRGVGITLFLVLFASGFYLNTCWGVWNLTMDYRSRILPALETLRGQEGTVVAVSHQHIAQELEATIEEKTFFLARHVEDLTTLARVLHREGYHEFLYLCYPPEGAMDCIASTLDNKDLTIRFTTLGKHGTYLFYEASILDVPQD